MLISNYDRTNDGKLNQESGLPIHLPTGHKSEKTGSITAVRIQRL